MSAAVSRCPVCKKAFIQETSPALPFCSARCRQIDLGRWLGEDYSLPVERSDEDREGNDDRLNPNDDGVSID